MPTAPWATGASIGWTRYSGSPARSGRPVSDIEEIYRSTNVSLLGMLSFKLGRSLEWDGEKEVVVGDPEANKHLSREYRGPWKYPTA